MSLVRSYLRIKGDFAELLGLGWAVAENVIEASRGEIQISSAGSSSRTWAFAEEVASFLEGFASQRPIIHFEHVLQLMQLMRSATDVPANANRLKLLCKSRPASLRFQGAFAAQLCADMPMAAEADAVLEILHRLRSREVTIHWFMLGKHESRMSSVAPLPARQFEEMVLGALDRFSDEEVLHWLEHGRGPVGKAGEKLVQAIPTGLVENMERALKRPRLRGAGAFVAQLNGVLALPPRRLAQQDLPLGGFTDITNAGKLEDLLLSQHALDEIDFFRRYAERELLFYRREDPNTQEKQELVVLLDQGVRTWGDVRLVLTAGVLALAGQAVRGKLPFLLATSSERRAFDPATLEPENLGRILERSDFTASPGAALTTLLQESAQPAREPERARARDIVVLTHPQCLDETQVRQALQKIPESVRLFALTLDRHGQAALHELRPGGPVAVREFRVDLTPARRIEPEADQTPADFNAWSGDIEPIGFPFHFGIHGKVNADCFDFDAREEYLLTASKFGLLHLWNLDGSLVEILPRGFYKGKVISKVAHVLGVRDGFVVVGQTADFHNCSVYYSLLTRQVKTWWQGRQHYQTYHYVAGYHVLLGIDLTGGGCALDLSTGERYVTSVGGGSSRTRAAWDLYDRGELMPRHVPIRETDSNRAFPRTVLQTDLTGQVTMLGRNNPPWGPFQFFENGKNVVGQTTLIDAQIGGERLVLRLWGKNRSNQLAIFRKDGILIRIQSIDAKMAFRLSAGGKLLARQMSNGIIRMGPTAVPDSAHTHTSVGGFNNHVRLYLGSQEIYLQPGSAYHRLNWQSGMLVHSIVHELPANLREVLPNQSATFDKERWTSRDLSGWMGDRFGQVAVVDRSWNLVAMFTVIRNQLAGWLPDGTCLGPMSLTGKQPHPNAHSRFGQALLRATTALAAAAHPGTIVSGPGPVTSRDVTP